jgi:hypothetical protein
LNWNLGRGLSFVFHCGPPASKDTKGRLFFQEN